MSPALWQTWFPGVEMPEGLTYEEFCAARDTIWHDEDVRMTIHEIKGFNRPIIKALLDDNYPGLYQSYLRRLTNKLEGLTNA